MNIPEITGHINNIHSEPIILSESFINMAHRFVKLPGTVLLMSGGEHDCARYHILGVKPWLTFKGRHQNMKITVKNSTKEFKADPFETLETILNAYQLKPAEYPKPLGAGLLGYLAYDLKDCLEELHRTSIDDLNLPHICMFAPSLIIIKDKITGLCRLHAVEPDCYSKEEMNKNIVWFKQILLGPREHSQDFAGDSNNFKSNISRPDYLKAVEKIKEYITAGHVYQVNMSQRFSMGFHGDGFQYFKALYQKNPAPFFAYLNVGDHQIISTSPERFILQQKNQVETRPIKGTRPRGKTPALDKALKKELQQSKKDDAELSMIVDLLRNDIGKVCKAGSVFVDQHKRIEAYQNVYHLVSVVKGTLGKKKNSVDLIKATFPGGSITGCPKIRSMEIIDELEPSRRHIYTGSIGYISFHQSMDLSIAIRTAVILNNQILFSVGGGIIYDSDPIDEFEETLHKGRSLMDLLEKKTKVVKSEAYAWHSGILKPVNQIKISAFDQGVQYGFGFFETIRVNNGCPCYLNAHIKRFNQTWQELFDFEPPDLSWSEIISQVLIKNKMENKTTALKIMVVKGQKEYPAIDYNLIITARPYTHRLSGRKEFGIRLGTYPEPRQSPLASHKTLNYLYYLLAGKWALKNEYDEAMILNPDNTISETNTANLLLIKKKEVILPFSAHVLPGIMQSVVCEHLVSSGYKVITRAIEPADLFEMDLVLITNSLMGAVPVISLDGKRLAKSTGL